MIIKIDNLTERTVTILKQENEVSLPVACAYMNSSKERAKLKCEVEEKYYNAVICVWGDEPIVGDVPTQ